MGLSEQKSRKVDKDNEDDEEEILLDDDSSGDADKKLPMKKRKRGRPVVTNSKSKKSKRSSAISMERKQKLLEEAKRDAKKEFEKSREEILKKIPKKYSNMFGSIGFTKWNKGTIIPVLILSPYEVPPGAVRQMWMDMFAKVRFSLHLSISNQIKIFHLNFFFGNELFRKKNKMFFTQ